MTTARALRSHPGDRAAARGAARRTWTRWRRAVLLQGFWTRGGRGDRAATPCEAVAVAPSLRGAQRRRGNPVAFERDSVLMRRDCRVARCARSSQWRGCALLGGDGAPCRRCHGARPRPGPVEQFTIPRGAASAPSPTRSRPTASSATPSWFRALARVRRLDRSVKAGIYRLPRGSRAWAVIDALEQGDQLMVKVTIPEGLTVLEMAPLVAQPARRAGRLVHRRGEGHGPGASARAQGLPSLRGRAAARDLSRARRARRRGTSRAS